ncbi:hypothetical protein PI124_g24430 [Phytophthora idaei]|nr:hypothetical protein PI125_g26848 [Phytophthora idaei]KAG3120492.1 hypothetical protein PI126_g24496 [Phytophthora idaei]KAG3230472.1 hypothetical protein PI124_g24430 [Phytophthora idaei]
MEDKGMVLLRAFSTISPTSPTGVVSIRARTSDDKNRDDGNDASRLRVFKLCFGTFQTSRLSQPKWTPC